jgi:hypothetical protein
VSVFLSQMPQSLSRTSKIALKSGRRPDRRHCAWTRGRTAKETRSTSVAGTPCPSSLMLMSNHSPTRRTITRRRCPACGEDCSPCCTAFSTSGWSEKGGIRAFPNPGSIASSNLNRLPRRSNRHKTGTGPLLSKINRNWT